ncbi:MAG: T9SS type A sorting domain-containing protein [Saprospiraceae bacterium]|nr:T9SS type A sorting domain-containing protein [Saprospiraceae bacterium]
MKKVLLPFTLFLVAPGLLLGHAVSVNGIVVDKHHQPQPGVKIVIMSAADDLFAIDTMIWTNEQGFFSLEFAVPNHIAEGTLMFSLDGCDEAKRIKYNPQRLQHTLVLKECPANTACVVTISSVELDDGIFLLTASAKGEEPVSYSWSTGEKTTSIKVKGEGVFWVAASLSNGCTARDIIHLRDSVKCATKIKLHPSVSVQGTYSLIARSKGRSPFVYLWSTGDTTQELEDPLPGEYCVTVVDADGCSSKDCFILELPTCETKVQPVSLGTNADATVMHLVARVEGHAPFNFEWSTGDTTKLIRIGKAGEYCVTVTDALGCNTSDCIVLDPSKLCKTQIVLLPATTGVNSALTLVARTHGRGPFAYRWDNGDSTKSTVVHDLAQYCVEVVDANGCVSNDCIDLSAITDQCDVVIKRSGAGLVAQPRGFPPFHFVWNTGDTTRIIQADSAIEYCVKMTNGFGCTASACIVLNADADVCRLKIQKQVLLGQKGYQLTARSNYNDHSFIWSTGDSSQTIVVTEDGEYCVKSTGSVCTLEECIEVDLSQAIPFRDLSVDQSGQRNPSGKVAKLVASPNPVTGEMRLTGEFGQESEVIIRDMTGRPVLIRKVTDEEGTQDIYLNLESLSSGLYVIQLIGNNLSEQIKIMKSQ